MKIPQLRLLVTSFCGRDCIYCRPTGEGVSGSSCTEFADIDKALNICALYKKNGGTEIKISGGDPIFWPHLIKFIYKAKNEIGIKKIELITRSPKVEEILDELITAGLDVLNFSLDTLTPEIYHTITRGKDFYELINAIKASASKLSVKINSVVMKGVNSDEINALIAFCEENNIDQLKLLDVIDDLQVDSASENRVIQRIDAQNLSDVYISMNEICDIIGNRAVTHEIVYQGGLGHPMNEYTMSSGLKITLKNSDNGAWYGSICGSCNRYPCHDALMSLRYTPDDMLQFCFLNEDTRVPLAELSSTEIENTFSKALLMYEEAKFKSKENRL